MVVSGENVSSVLGEHEKACGGNGGKLAMNAQKLYQVFTNGKLNLTQRRKETQRRTQIPLCVSFAPLREKLLNPRAL
jgi:hypothetical protein